MDSLLGLDQRNRRWPMATTMMTSASTFVGCEITEVLGLVEGISEASFGAVAVGGMEISEGGGLRQLVEAAKNELAQHAADRGADAVVGCSHQIIGRSLEKSALADGTAVKCQRVAKAGL